MWLLLPFFFLFQVNASAQVKKVVLAPVESAHILDTLPVAVVALHVKFHNKALVFGADYSMDNEYKVLLISHPELYDSLQVEYQTFPDWFLATQTHQQPLYSVVGDVPRNGIDPNNNKNASTEGDVVTDGVLLRGISFGNAQDLVLNSSLNLRMYGKVGKDIEIEGAVTDQEYPFQPEGTTTTLQDFDRIYIALKMPHFGVLLGDHPLISPEGSRFMKYSKKNRGLLLSGQDTFGRSQIQWNASAALARGRFNRNELNGVEGLQGPYRLTGARNEQFVIVVSGTEVVYLDGEKMQRGLQSDYVIDYNTGEITFTPKHIINAFSRIVVEFQYSDRFYTRSIASGSTTISRSKANYTFSVYSEQDAKSQPIQQDLTAYDSTTGLTAREILQKSGDNVNLAVLPGARKNQIFSTTEPNYVLVDTGIQDYYLYVAQPDTFATFYRVNFSYVGPGKGFYQITGSTANGKVFKYVGSISGVPAGDYDAVSPLQAPNRLSMAEAGSVFNPRKGTVIRANVSVSSNDKNLFSGVGDKDNQGMAGYLQIVDRRALSGKDSGKQWYVLNTVQAEQTTANFITIERHRDVEFGREWNRSLYNPANGTNPGNSGFVTAGTEIGKGSLFAAYASAGINKTNGQTAQNAKIGVRSKYKGFFAEPYVQRIEGNLGGLSNAFKKGQTDFGYDRNGNKAQIGLRKESSRYTNALMESLPQNYGLREMSFFLQRQRESVGLSLNGLQRVNQNIVGFSLFDAVRVTNINAEINRSGKSGNRLKMGLGFRKMVLLNDTFRSLYSNDNHTAARVEYQFSNLLKIISGNVFYQSQSGREQQRQYSYFEVPAGQGFFTWIDFNGNGVKEVNEFQESPFKDQAKYVRLLVPTGNYITAQGTEFTGNFLVKPNIKEKLGTISNRLSWNYTGKSVSKNLFEKMAPFFVNPENANVLANNVFLRNLLEYQSANSQWLIQHNTQTKASKLFFTNGFDLRKSIGQQVFIRGFIGSQWQFKLQCEQKNSQYASEFIPNNNFKYQLLGIEPSMAWQPGSRLRLGVFGKWQQYQGRIPDQKVAQLTEGGFTVNKALGKGGMLELKSSVLQANYLLINGTPLAYDVLQGFSPGRNFRGTADLRFNAAKNIQIVMSYEGRKTGDVRMVHIGRAEARYLF